MLIIAEMLCDGTYGKCSLTKVDLTGFCKPEEKLLVHVKIKDNGVVPTR